jgi:hypothetical protein
MSKGKGRTIATDLAGQGGKILAGGFSPRLCRRLTECVAAMAALEKIASPIVPYIAAWREHEKIIWYEYVGARFLALLGCDRGKSTRFFGRASSIGGFTGTRIGRAGSRRRSSPGPSCGAIRPACARR